MSKKTLMDVLRDWWQFTLRSDLKDANPDFTQRSHKGDNVVPQSINAHFDPAKHHVKMMPVIGAVSFKDQLDPLCYGKPTTITLPLTAQAGNDRLPVRVMTRKETKEAIHTRQLQMAANCGVPIMHPLFLFMQDDEIDGLLKIAKALAKEPNNA